MNRFILFSHVISQQDGRGNTGIWFYTRKLQLVGWEWVSLSFYLSGIRVRDWENKRVIYGNENMNQLKRSFKRFVFRLKPVSLSTNRKREKLRLKVIWICSEKCLSICRGWQTVRISPPNVNWLALTVYTEKLSTAFHCYDSHEDK